MSVSVSSSFHTHFPKPIAAVLSRPNKMRVPFNLKQGQSRIFHQLPSGLSMEVIMQKGVAVAADAEKMELEKKRKDNNNNTVENGNPALVFVHGSYHAAWCWAEHWLPFFSASGYDCYALSLLGQVHTHTLSKLVPSIQT